MNKLIAVLVAILPALECRAVPAAAFYVATHGKDTNAGTEDQPFATLERARDEIRRCNATGPLPAAGITVELRGGIYELSRPWELAPQDSGTEDAPVVYRARPGETVRLVGGRVVSGWKPVTDPAVLSRLDESARGQVWQADLKALGITDLQGINDARSYQSDPGLGQRHCPQHLLGRQVGLDGAEGQTTRQVRRQPG